MIKNSDLIRHNLDETVRAWREGGIGYVVVPCSKPNFVSWPQEVPRQFLWSALRGGPSFLTPLNASDEPIGNSPEEVILAAHPSEYDVGWQVPKLGRAAPGFRRRIRLSEITSVRKIFIGILRFPPDADLLSARTRFDRLNAEWLIRRLSREDQRRHVLPYGAEIFGDGREVLFNRKYQPIYERWPQGIAVRNTNPAESAQRIHRRWFYDNGHSEAQKRRSAEAALKLFLSGEPMAFEAQQKKTIG